MFGLGLRLGLGLRFPVPEKRPANIVIGACGGYEDRNEFDGKTNSRCMQINMYHMHVDKLSVYIRTCTYVSVYVF